MPAHPVRSARQAGRRLKPPEGISGFRPLKSKTSRGGVVEKPPGDSVGAAHGSLPRTPPAPAQGCMWLPPETVMFSPVM